MAFLTAQGISSVAVELLVRKLVLPRTVTTQPGGEFAGHNGDTLTIRVRVPRTARVQSTPGATITYDAFSEVPVQVSLTHLYDAGRLTDEDLSLNLRNFAMQVTEPQVASVATGAEDELATAMNGIAADDSFALTADPADTDAKILAARETLSSADVPSDNRWLAVAPDIYTRLLSVDKFVRADATGDGVSSAIRRAIVGRIYGFQVIESNGLTAGTAVAYHKSGLVFANRVPVRPRGAYSSATAQSQGIGMRQIFQYQPDILSDASVLSTFAGAGVIDLDRIYKLDTATT